MAVWAGYSLGGTQLPEDELAPYIAQAIDQVSRNVTPISHRQLKVRYRSILLLGTQRPVLLVSEQSSAAL